MKHITWHSHKVSKSDRANLNSQKPCIIWFTGLSGSGKSTIAGELEYELFQKGYRTYLLDGDNVRHALNRDLGFSDHDRKENIRRIGEVCKLFVDAGIIVLSAFISPFKEDRESVRGLVEFGEFIEVFVDTPLEVCEARDPKGLYKKARNGEIKEFSGIDSPYEPPLTPELHIQNLELNDAVGKILDYLETRGYLCRN